MPTFQFEAMDATGSEIKDVIDAPTEEEAQATIRQMGYFVTKIAVKKGAAKAGTVSGRKKRGFAIGGASTKVLAPPIAKPRFLRPETVPALAAPFLTAIFVTK